MIDHRGLAQAEAEAARQAQKTEREKELEESFAPFDAKRDCEDTEEAEGFGITVAELKLARKLDLDPAELRVWRGASSLAEAEAAEAEYEAKREAKRRRLIDEN